MKNKIGIIGGGPAGMMAAIAAADENNQVTIIEKNEKLGKKLFITGKGRCNITNNRPIDEFISCITTNPYFMYSSLYSFTNTDIIRLLESEGLRTKVERGERVFPKSNKSSDVIKTFEKILKKKDVSIKLNSNVKKVKKDDELFLVYLEDEILAFNKLIIATGGKSYPKTGSTGDGYKFAEAMGHTIVDIKPSLIPIETKEEFLYDLVGLSLRNVKVTCYSNNKKIYEELGEMVFTHYGISGPIILPMSTSIYKHNKENISISIDLKPGLSEKQLDNRLLRDFEKYNNKFIKNALNDLLPSSLIEPIIKLSNIELERNVDQLTKEERQRLLSRIKDFRLNFKCFRPVNEAIVTSGGIDVDEIDPSTMESKLVDNLYFAGEVIDVDGITGGFNLQIAYSTGYLAGINL